MIILLLRRARDRALRRENRSLEAVRSEYLEVLQALDPAACDKYQETVLAHEEKEALARHYKDRLRRSKDAGVLPESRVRRDDSSGWKANASVSSDSGMQEDDDGV